MRESKARRRHSDCDPRPSPDPDLRTQSGLHDASEEEFLNDRRDNQRLCIRHRVEAERLRYGRSHSVRSGRNANRHKAGAQRHEGLRYQTPIEHLCGDKKPEFLCPTLKVCLSSESSNFYALA
jgi:hypothetical protein